MLRIRTIKPEFYHDERIADLSYPAAFHFPGLWILADRAGRLRDRPREIKARIAPLRDVDMDAILTELADAGLVIRYTVLTERYLQVCNFERHQRPNSRESTSGLPSPDSADSSGKCKPARARTRTHVQARAGSRGREREGNGNGKGTGTGTALAVIPDHGFEAFWSVFRKKTHRQEALAAWMDLSPAPELQARILAAVTWQFRQPRWLEDGCQYAPNGATYLNKARWTDEPPPASTNGLGEKEARNLAAAARFVQAAKGTA